MHMFMFAFRPVWLQAEGLVDGEKSGERWSSPWLDSNAVHPILITYGSHPREYLPSSVFLPLFLLLSSSSSLASSATTLHYHLSLFPSIYF